VKMTKRVRVSNRESILLENEMTGFYGASPLLGMCNSYRRETKGNDSFRGFDKARILGMRLVIPYPQFLGSLLAESTPLLAPERC
jgi:hypothetical protein